MCCFLHVWVSQHSFHVEGLLLVSLQAGQVCCVLVQAWVEQGFPAQVLVRVAVVAQIYAEVVVQEKQLC